MFKQIQIILLFILTKCGTFQPDHTKLNMVLLGFDSIVCYYGNSLDTMHLTHGKITDSAFITNLFATASDYGQLSVILKPTAAGDIIPNIEQITGLLNQHGLKNHSIDTLNEKERIFFNTISLQDFVAERQELDLFVPKDDPNETDIPVTANTVVILLYGKDGVYAYTGKNIKDGKFYSYKSLNAFLAEKKSRKDFCAIIKPGESMYANTVDMLDVMTQQGIKNYRLADMSKEESDVIKQ